MNLDEAIEISEAIIAGKSRSYVQDARRLASFLVTMEGCFFVSGEHVVTLLRSDTNIEVKQFAARKKEQKDDSHGLDHCAAGDGSGSRPDDGADVVPEKHDASVPNLEG